VDDRIVAVIENLAKPVVRILEALATQAEAEIAEANSKLDPDLGDPVVAAPNRASQRLARKVGRMQ